MGKPEDIPQDVLRAATDLDVNCARQSCADDLCDGFLCRKAMVEIYSAAKAEEREACEQIMLGYPPEGFNAALYERTERHDQHDPFWKFEGDTGNWAALMGEVLKPYAAAIRKRGEG